MADIAQRIKGKLVHSGRVAWSIHHGLPIFFKSRFTHTRYILFFWSFFLLLHVKQMNRFNEWKSKGGQK
jgi:hypothetical protein